MRKLSKILVTILITVMTLGEAVGCARPANFAGGGADLSRPEQTVPERDVDSVLSDLNVQFTDSLNKDLVKKVDEYRLSGPVNAIITFSSDSVVSLYNEKGAAFESVKAYRASKDAKKFVETAAARRDNVTARLKKRGLIDDVKYTYNTILDGVFVSTEYENLAAISRMRGVERVMVSNVYEPSAAVTNKVNVYDTGIFDSSDVPYTGKGTVVAILDTGCDYTHTAFTTHDVVDPLLDRNDIAHILPSTVAYSYDESVTPRDVYYGNITKNKIAYGFDYADKDPDVMPYASEHGTHVAGIIGGSDERITGVAVDTQLAIMKVFSDYDEGAEDGDILAALEDAVLLDVDAINMSLGTSCGFSREVDETYKNEIYDSINRAGISLIAAASNDYSSAYGSEFGNTNKTRNPDSATVGAPSTYDAALSVASINGRQDKYMLANGNQEVFFLESFNQAAEEYDFFQMLGVTAGTKTVFDYVTVPGVGMAANYMGLDVAGKIALVKRGDISFEEKAQFAYEAGAAAIIIYNNVFGDIIMTVGNNVKIPAISISKDDGVILAARETGTLEFDLANRAGPFMSDFSSWGPTPDLKLKPEITAHGGNILSSVPGGGYDELSGTSMASPNMCGIVILIRQYVKEKFPELSAVEARDMVNRLCMSTATIALDRKGNPYSPRKQGAGLASLSNAVSTDAYLYVEGINKTKLDLGDDPKRTGVYSMTFKLKNMSDGAVSYRLDDLTMTESLSSSDKEYVAEMAYMLSAGAEYSVTGGTFDGGVVRVDAGGTADITATITLSKQDKSYLNANFENGMYVEGFITLTNTDESGVDLSVPYLAFYGNWSDAPIFDETYYNVETEAHNDAIDEDDKIKADYFATTPYGKYYYDYIIPLGSYVYEIDETQYSYLPAKEDKAALSYYKDSISGIYAVFTGLLRGAKEMKLEITDTASGKTVWSDTQYNCYKAHNSGAIFPYVSEFDLDMADTKTGAVFGDNNSHYRVTMSAKLDWDNDTRNSNDTFSFSFYIDYEPPTIVDSAFRTEYDKTLKKNRYYADLTVYDNHYAMSLRPIVVYDYTDETGAAKKTYAPLSDTAIPVYQNNRGENTVVTVEITDYIDLIEQSALPEGLTLYVDDYAMNSNICYVNFPETDDVNLSFASGSLDLDIHDTFDLTGYLKSTGGQTQITGDYLKNLTWKSSDDSVVAVDGGQIEALKAGSATIQCTSATTGRSISLVVNVSSDEAVNPDDKNSVSVKSLKFSSYDTIFAFNSDIDYSDIGQSGTTNYFGDNFDLSFYPSEKIKLNYLLEPWNIDPSRYRLIWSSSNPRVATVDDNGVVTGEAEGRCRITLQIEVDGRVSIIAARCSVEIKSEFIIENRTLVAYKGKGGDVVIPADKGILYVGSFAFSHYNLDNTKEVEDKFDIDLKKEPIGNNTVTSVTVPKGVQEIRKYAFYNSKLLQKVTLPSDCKKVFEYAFYNNGVLDEINLGNVQVIGAYAFAECGRLTEINTAKANTIGDSAFLNCKLIRSADLRSLKRSGENAFSGCVRLETVKFGEMTQLAVGILQNTAVAAVELYGDQIPDRAFAGCTKLRSVTVKGELTYLGKEAFSGCTRLSSFAFEKGCETVGPGAFYNCASLTSMTLPAGTVSIGDFAFEKSGLRRLTFAPTTQIAEIGVGIFTGATELTALVATGSEHYSSRDGMLFSRDGRTLMLAPPAKPLGAYTLPDNITKIGDGAFAANPSLTSFTAGAGLTEIGYGAFSGCSALVSVTLNGACTRLGDFAFYKTSALRTIDMPSVTHIGQYAFAASGIAEATVGDGAMIGDGAFYACASLAKVTLGENVTVGKSSFQESAVQLVVMPEKPSVAVGNAAFFKCRKLASIDLSKAVGELGEYSFFLCDKLKTADLVNVTVIGEGSFADCLSLATVNIPNVTYIGGDAFSVFSTQEHGAVFTEIDMPEVRYIGKDAFYGCLNLQAVNLPEIETIEMQAFAFCESLQQVTLGEKLKTLNDATFYGCVSLTEINLNHIEKIGSSVIFQTKVSELSLDSCVEAGVQAFAESAENGNYLTTVYAPRLKVLGDQAFYGCVLLTELDLPALESIGYGAVVGTGITQFAVTEKLTDISYSAFGGADRLTAFVYEKDGQTVSDIVLDNLVLDKGVLYTVMDNGAYLMSAYPAAKADKEYTVLDGTRRIEYAAAMGNTKLERVVLPGSLKTIGNLAFYGCDNLKEVEFRSYYAPTLEGTLTMKVEITPDSRENYPKFDKLYKYDYYYTAVGVVAMPLYYQNFVDTVTSAKASALVYMYPASSSGYDSTLYTAYFNDKLDGDGNRLDAGVVAGKFAVDFMTAYERLPETVDRFDRETVGAVRTAYNALLGHTDELRFVDEAAIERFLSLERICNADIVTDRIDRIYDVDRSEYSYNRIRDVYRAYEALTAEEKALVSNHATLESKLADLKREMANEIDFDKEFSEYVFPTENVPGTNGLPVWAIVLIAVGAALAAAGAAAVAVLLIRKRRAKV